MSANAVPVSGVWLRTIGDHVEVLAEIDGEWKLLIRDHRESNISHIIEPLGMRAAKADT